MCNLKWLIILLGFGNCANCWSLFPKPETSFHSFAKQKISDLKNLRTLLHTQTLKVAKPPQISNATLDEEKDEQVREIVENLEKTFNISSKSKEFSTENFIQNILAKKDYLAKISDEMREKLEKLEPEVKKYLADKYNLFLNNLVPYSETIGVPPYVLNSLKFPENFDPRLQKMIQSLIKVKGSSVGNLFRGENENNLERKEGRSDNIDELVSDQEPDATSKGFRKYQHFFLAPRNRHNKGFSIIPSKNAQEISFDNIGDGSFIQEGVDSYGKGYYVEDYPYGSRNDMDASAGSHVARGHNSRGDHGHGGYGHGHGGGGGGNGLMDPFTILGGLAFLTYLGLLIQQSLNRTGAAGRSDDDNQFSSLRKKIILTPLTFDTPHSLENFKPKSKSNEHLDRNSNQSENDKSESERATLHVHQHLREQKKILKRQIHSHRQRGELNKLNVINKETRNKSHENSNCMNSHCK